MLLNLLPLPPLDGGRILVGVLPYRQARAVAAIEPYGFLVLILLLVANRAVPFLSLLFTPVRWLEAIMLPSGLARLVGG
jgi:Zn-dependent protease